MNITKLTSNFALLFTIAIPSFVHAAAPTAWERAADSFFLIAGYPTEALYMQLTGATSATDPNGPAMTGLLGTMQVFEAALGTHLNTTKGYTCSTIPTSGTDTLTISGVSTTLTYAAATRTIPTGHTSAGSKYDKRFVLTQASGLEIAIEALCADPVISMEFKSPEGTLTRRGLLYMDAKGSPLHKADFYMVAKTDAGYVRDAQVIRHEIDTANTHSLWSIYYFDRTSTPTDSTAKTAERLFVRGNFTTKQNSFNMEVMAVANLAALSSSSVAPVSTSLSADWLATSPHAGAQGSIARQGCLTALPVTTNPSSTAVCTDLDFSNAAAPIIDTTGTFSIDWLKTMDSKITWSL